MGLRDGLRRWYELNARVFAKIHRIADVVSGLSLIAIIVLALSVAQALPAVSIPLLPGPSEAAAKALYVAVGVFVLSVLVQTAAGLRSFFSRLTAKLFE